jgi:methyl-accepting chemotaxis protein PixJ
MVKTYPDNSSPKLKAKPATTSLADSQKLSQVEEIEDTLFTGSKKSTITWWQKKSIRGKAIIIAIAIGTLPTATLGLIAYSAANHSITKEITTVRKTLATDVQNKLNLFMSDRFKDIQMMSDLDLFTNPQLRNTVSTQEKVAALEKIQKIYGIYDSIAVFDLQGEVIAQTGEKPLGNHLDRDYIQSALKSNNAVLSQPRISASSGTYSVYAAAPIKDKISDQTIGVIRARMPVAVLKEILQDFTQEGDDYYLLDETGTIFLSSARDYVIPTLSNSKTATKDQEIKIEQVFGGISQLLTSNVPVTEDSAIDLQNNQQKQFITYVPAKQTTGDFNLNWRTLVTTESSQVFASQRRLGQIYALGTIAIAGLVGIIAFYLAELATRPIVKAAVTVSEIGKGNLKARTNLRGEDEVAQLGTNIDLMALQLENFVKEQHLLAQQTDLVKRAIFAFSNISEQEKLWEIAVTQTKLGLAVDGVSYYSLESKQIIAESPASGIELTAITAICTSTLVTEFLQQSSSEAIVTNNLLPETDKLKTVFPHHFAIAKVKHQEKPVGLLIAYQEATTQPWQQSELDFLAQIANQVNFTLDRLAFLQQQQEAQKREKQAKEQLQQRALELLQQVEPLSQGDLTIRAKVTEDEIGTVADSYNATIYSLQKLVTQVKKIAEQVEQTAGANQSIIQQLASEAVQQALSIELTMEQIQQMTESIEEVSQSASTAQKIVEQANQTILTGDTTMNQAVAQINALQATVSETEQKVRILGESSQEISQVVNSISRFAAQTHLLALKASIEAARAGEQGKGFATIADEVRSLATQSATATTDIENIVAKIQLETNAVVAAMAQGTEQVTLGTNLVKQTRQSLNQVTAASQEISQLVATIAQSAQGQSTISQEVSENIASVAVSAQTNSQSATQVSLKIEQLLSLANKLQTDIGQFKT